LKYFTHFRLSMAKYYLSSQKELQIKEVSELVGFHNCGYFCTVFKKSEGITPDEFRKINAF
ncbi:MAG: helix-turn-helix domain-containing protein, partial [Oscillospiraceae bacterium]